MCNKVLMKLTTTAKASYCKNHGTVIVIFSNFQSIKHTQNLLTGKIIYRIVSNTLTRITQIIDCLYEISQRETTCHCKADEAHDVPLTEDGQVVNVFTSPWRQWRHVSCRGQRRWLWRRGGRPSPRPRGATPPAEGAQPLPAVQIIMKSFHIKFFQC